MSKRSKKPPSKPSNAYLISFGDTMTAMLAFFIVLNTLAQEQTGVNLHSGTGSFVNSVANMGLPGMFSGKASKHVKQMEDASPKYIVNDQPDREAGVGDGPDEQNNSLRVIDRQAEQFQRLLVEMEQLFDVQTNDIEANEIAFDLFERLGKAPEMLPGDARRVLAQSTVLLRRPDYRIEIAIWAPTPSNSALARSVKNGVQIKQEILRDFPMLAGRKDAVGTAARIWPHSDERRPVMTINIVKIKPAAR